MPSATSVGLELPQWQLALSIPPYGISKRNFSISRSSRCLARPAKRRPVYGSGGFTSYTVARLQEQLSGWVEQGIPRVKMKIGTHPDADLDRVRAARNAIGDKAELFVDANGAYSRKQALAFAARFTDLGVTWFEEPVSADDLDGLHLIRDRAPAGMDVAAGEYGFDPWYFRHMLEAGAVDVLQADATRCGGYTGFFQAAALVHRSLDAAVRSLRPGLTRPSVLLRFAAAQHRILLRPCAHRTDAVRRRLDSRSRAPCTPIFRVPDMDWN